MILLIVGCCFCFIFFCFDFIAINWYGVRKYIFFLFAGMKFNTRSIAQMSVLKVEVFLEGASFLFSYAAYPVAFSYFKSSSKIYECSG